ncbi:bcl-2-modifying factor-like isoform X1 [Polyodon spathula]|uniref:bcl-2-modifying factor-like isoform X1 n=1 Tax=Polyodon spathula TaxID=7913 RepID=UPI001B7E6E23|nr:bcl-2-modifying factor-like isoform X1 [Polyodon spathula]
MDSDLDEVDDDVFHPDDAEAGGPEKTIVSVRCHCSCSPLKVPLHFSYCRGTRFREIRYEDKETQTTSPVMTNRDIMLPCSVREEPLRLFYGNAGYRLHFPADFEQNRDAVDDELVQERNQGGEQPVLSAEARIGQKLQQIGDQFQRDYTLMGPLCLSQKLLLTAADLPRRVMSEPRPPEGKTSVHRWQSGGSVEEQHNANKDLTPGLQDNF